MATDPASLLPPNASLAERAIERAVAVPLAIDIADVSKVWDPVTCPVDLLPWLAWALSVDRWRADWTADQKRAAVAASIELHRHKGTRATVEAVIHSFDALMYVVEWWEMSPRGTPHTFDIVVPVDLYDGPLSPETIAEIVREVVKVKPARSHLTVVQSLPLSGRLGFVAGGQTAGFVRIAADAPAYDPVWAGYLQTQDGEPLLDQSGTYLEEI